eukprot:CAMPEP_0172791432 /NCGR_PEP_ID=MMETSP1074-20121228/208465_1 /TAXON_ID=2916 /ORGANISM="Ceratium fusus, Strain PA161109" /LENGTH=64 /DNA_ID=CAMNT_0013628489 /DNA_START=1182 /DNA_END=1372 /DNA_ORIENTATION=+
MDMILPPSVFRDRHSLASSGSASSCGLFSGVEARLVRMFAPQSCGPPIGTNQDPIRPEENSAVL